jgi:hypothetical protein
MLLSNRCASIKDALDTANMFLQSLQLQIGNLPLVLRMVAELLVAAAEPKFPNHRYNAITIGSHSFSMASHSASLPLSLTHSLWLHTLALPEVLTRVV